MFANAARCTTDLKDDIVNFSCCEETDYLETVSIQDYITVAKYSDIPFPQSW